MRYYPSDVRDIPLAVKYETRALWPGVRDLIGVDKTGAAISVALYEAPQVSEGWVSYPRSKDYYAARESHPLLGYRPTIRAVDMLDAGDWIDHRRQVPGGRGWQSSMRASPKLLEAMDYLIGNSLLPYMMPRSTIFLRDKDGKPLPLPRDRRLLPMSRNVDRINEAICSVDVRGENGARLAAPLVRIYNGHLDRGGRFYAQGTSWQNIPSADRRRITIDGEPVVEWDYKTLHPALLYGQVGIDPPADAYQIEGWTRSVAKRAFCIMINARDPNAARLAIADNGIIRAEWCCDYREANWRAARLMEDIARVHRPIAKFFNSDAGGRLMRTDSDLAEAVQLKLRKRGVVVLPVHDSFLVQSSKSADLEAAMVEMAQIAGVGKVQVERKEDPPAPHMSVHSGLTI